MGNGCPAVRMTKASLQGKNHGLIDAISHAAFEKHSLDMCMLFDCPCVSCNSRTSPAADSPQSFNRRRVDRLEIAFTDAGARITSGDCRHALR